MFQTPKRTRVPRSTKQARARPTSNEPHDTLFCSSHFEKFGKLTNIHIKKERSAAVISFESVAQAKRAISSPDAVCGNRFIRVSWQRHLPGELGLQIPSGRPDGAKHAAAGSGSAGEQKGRGGPRGGAPPPFKKAKHEEHAGGPAGKRAGHVASSASKQLELEQMKRQLIQKQLAQQKMLLETLSQKKSTLSAEDKKSLMQKLSQLTKTIESSLKESSRVAVAQASAAREREAVAAEASKQKEEEEKKGEEMAKAALDSELEEIAAGEGAEGEEVTVVGEVDEQGVAFSIHHSPVCFFFVRSLPYFLVFLSVLGQCFSFCDYYKTLTPNRQRRRR